MYDFATAAVHCPQLIMILVFVHKHQIYVLCSSSTLPMNQYFNTNRKGGTNTIDLHNNYLLALLQQRFYVLCISSHAFPSLNLYDTSLDMCFKKYSSAVLFLGYLICMSIACWPSCHRLSQNLLLHRRNKTGIHPVLHMPQSQILRMFLTQ